jgi:hypothetical protein
MSYHVIYSLPDASIVAGPGGTDDDTFHTFEEAKAAAIEDLEHWAEKIQLNIDELREAQTIGDLS